MGMTGLHNKIIFLKLPVPIQDFKSLITHFMHLFCSFLSCALKIKSLLKRVNNILCAILKDIFVNKRVVQTYSTSTFNSAQNLLYAPHAVITCKYSTHK